MSKYSADIGVRDLAGEDDFPPEALDPLLVGGDLWANRLQRDRQQKHEVLGLVDLSRPALGDEADDPETAG
jgi:hypothetical protein